MKRKHRMGFALVACLILCAAFFTLRAMARMIGSSRPSPVRKATQPRRPDLLRGKRLLALGQYELNAAFTPDGTFYCFDISAQPAQTTAAKSPRA